MCASLPSWGKRHWTRNKHDILSLSCPIDSLSSTMFSLSQINLAHRWSAREREFDLTLGFRCFSAWIRDKWCHERLVFIDERRMSSKWIGFICSRDRLLRINVLHFSMTIRFELVRRTWAEEREIVSLSLVLHCSQINAFIVQSSMATHCLTRNKQCEKMKQRRRKKNTCFSLSRSPHWHMLLSSSFLLIVWEHRRDPFSFISIVVSVPIAPISSRSSRTEKTKENANTTMLIILRLRRWRNSNAYFSRFSSVMSNASEFSWSLSFAWSIELRRRWEWEALSACRWNINTIIIIITSHHIANGQWRRNVEEIRWPVNERRACE